jgi:hypothetical protein
MGEKLYVISELEYKNIKFDIELNAGSAEKKYPLHIHIQNERFRFDITESDYLQMAIAICSAKEKLVKCKNIHE